MKEDIKVSIADYKISIGPNRIITLGLGSCVGISIYDRLSDFGGLAHIMLPDSSQFKNIIKIGKYADLAIPNMLEELLAKGINKRGLVAKIAGGASMFRFSDEKLTMDIGARNIIAVRNSLKQLGIPLIAEDVGGNSGRTMILDLENKSVHIKTVGKGIILL
jgi:chemotaxis protein CheD